VNLAFAPSRAQSNGHPSAYAASPVESWLQSGVSRPHRSNEQVLTRVAGRQRSARGSGFRCHVRLGEPRSGLVNDLDERED
jgi:hypothetical protein